LEIFEANGADASEKFHSGADMRRTAVALGNFDGVHLGHRRLLEQTVSAALDENLRSCVWSFGTHTQNALCPDEPVKIITSTEERADLFERLGIQAVIFEDFPRVRDMEPAGFIDRILLGRLRCAHAVCGFDYRFGRGGTGDAGFLREELARRGTRCTVIDPVRVGGTVVSSTAIRRLIEAGDMESAAAMLGRPYSIRLPVIRGRRLGSALGIPTVNQRFPDGRVIPARGVYVCECDPGQGEGPRRAVCDIGTRPTVSEDIRVVCETHILDYGGDLYGRVVEVRFLARLRDERRFASLEELRAQIGRDIDAARRFTRP